jgi:hypothetical protein
MKSPKRKQPVHSRRELYTGVHHQENTGTDLSAATTDFKIMKEIDKALLENYFGTEYG